MTGKITIRKMCDADRGEWARMYRALFPRGNETSINDEIDRILSAPTRAGYCAEMGGEIVGFAEYSLRDFANGCVSQPVPFLEGIWVEPDARKKGVARALVEHLEAQVIAQGYSELGSDVLLDDDPSIEFHKSVGFQETERVIFFRKPL